MFSSNPTLYLRRCGTNPSKIFPTRDAYRIRHQNEVKIQTENMRKYAAEQGVAEEVALKKGSELYAKA
jgi:hypothetical protein